MLIKCNFFWSYAEVDGKVGGVHSRPLDSDDLRMIEEDLSKQIGSSPRDAEWEDEPEFEPYVTGLENGGRCTLPHFVSCGISLQCM